MSRILDITAATGDARKKKFFSVVNSPYKAGIKNGGDEATYSSTSGFIVIDNGIARGDTPNGNVIVVPDYIKFTCVTAPAADGMRFVWKTDIGNRYSSGGSSLTTLAANTFVDTFSNFTRVTPAAQIHAGSLTLSAEVSAAVVGVTAFRATVGAVATVVGDEYTVAFDGGPGGSIVSPSLGSIKSSWALEPVFLGPGSAFTGHLVIDGATADIGEFKVEIGWTELAHDYNA